MSEDTKMVEIFIVEAETNPVRLCVNGRTAIIHVGVETLIDPYFLPSLDTATLRYREVDRSAPNEAAPIPAATVAQPYAGTAGSQSPAEAEAEARSDRDAVASVTAGPNQSGSATGSPDLPVGPGAAASRAELDAQAIAAGNEGQRDVIEQHAKDGGGSDEGKGDDFNAEDLIKLNVEDLRAKLADKPLTNEQLIALRDAENDREVPRAGALKAIELAIDYASKA